MDLKKVLKVKWDKSEQEKTIKFLAGFAAFFLILNFITGLIPLPLIESFVANLSLFFLQIFGIQGSIEFSEPVKMLLGNETILISYLCTGLLEWIIIVSAILASFGIDIKKRFSGVLFSTIGIIVFNLIRIDLTILIIKFFSIEIAEIGHEILFRLFLALAIVGFYYLWFKWATENKNPLEVLKKIFRIL